MAKSKSRMYGGNKSMPKSKSGYGSIGSGGNDEGGKFVDRNLMSVNPMKEQFEPTPSEPVPQRYKMGGGC